MCHNDLPKGNFLAVRPRWALGGRGSGVLRAMRERDAKRDDRLGELIANNTKWMVTLVGVCGLGVLAAIVLAIVAMS